LAKDWITHDVKAAGVLLIDGHVRVYHGEATKLPRRYVSREKLCLRGTTDYWVNALDEAPFFCVTKAIDPGLQKTLEEEIDQTRVCSGACPWRIAPPAQREGRP
jgi:hypothetical protein